FTPNWTRPATPPGSRSRTRRSEPSRPMAPCFITPSAGNGTTPCTRDLARPRQLLIIDDRCPDHQPPAGRRPWRISSHQVRSSHDAEEAPDACMTSGGMDIISPRPDYLLFLTASLRRPRVIGAVAPSSVGLGELLATVVPRCGRPIVVE